MRTRDEARLIFRPSSHSHLSFISLPFSSIFWVSCGASSWAVLLSLLSFLTPHPSPTPLLTPLLTPPGDLGVQRGLLRWVLARHSPDYTVQISPKKLPRLPSEEPSVPGGSGGGATPADPDVLPVLAPAPAPDAAAAVKGRGRGRKAGGTDKAKTSASERRNFQRMR